MGSRTHTDIRLATRADAAVLQLFLEELAASMGKPGAIKGSVANLERHGFGPARLFKALIAAQDGIDIGFVLFFPEYSSWRGRPGIYVQDLYVVASARRTGAARALLARAAQYGGEMGGTYLRLSASADNLAAQRFYERIRFRSADDERLFVLEGEPLDSLLSVCDQRVD